MADAKDRSDDDAWTEPVRCFKELNCEEHFILQENECLESRNEKNMHHLYMQSNGNVVLKNGSTGRRVWHTNTANKGTGGPYTFGFFEDKENSPGKYHLLLLDGSKNPIWSLDKQLTYNTNTFTSKGKYTLRVENDATLLLQNASFTSHRCKRVLNHHLSPFHSFPCLDYIAITEDNEILGDSKSDDSEELVNLSNKWKYMLDNGNKRIGSLNMSFWRFIIMIVPFVIAMTMTRIFSQREKTAETRIWCFLCLKWWFYLCARLFQFVDKYFGFLAQKLNCEYNVCQWDDLCNFGVCVNKSISEIYLDHIRNDVITAKHFKLGITQFFVMIGPLFGMNQIVSFFGHFGHHGTLYKLFTELAGIFGAAWMGFCIFFIWIYDWLSDAASYMKEYILFGTANIYSKSFRIIAESMPWKTMFDIFTNAGCCFNRNEILALQDELYPAYEVFNIRNKNKGSIDSVTIDENDELYQDAKYAVRYAAFIYFAEFLGKPRDIDILDGPYTPTIAQRKVGQAGYFIGLDRVNQKLLLCIRGSSTLGDFGADIDAYATKNVKIGHTDKSGYHELEYYVHPGVWMAARNLDLKVSEIMVHAWNEYKNEFDNLEIIVTGHSLGAGVASLLSIIWFYELSAHEMKGDIRDIKHHFRCFSFASPLVVDDNLRKLVLKDMKLNNGKNGSYRNIITSIVNQYDMVTRMSFRTFEEAQANMNYNRFKEVYADAVFDHKRERVAQGKPRLVLHKMVDHEYSQCEFDVAYRKPEYDNDETGGVEPIKKKLFGCGNIVWRARDVWVDDFNNPFNSAWHCIDKSYNIIRDDDQSSIIMSVVRQFVTDFFGIYQPKCVLLTINQYGKNGKHGRNKRASKELTARIFHNVVFNVQALLYHMPGGYSNAFGVSIREVSQMGTINVAFRWIFLALYFCKSFLQFFESP